MVLAKLATHPLDGGLALPFSSDRPDLSELARLLCYVEAMRCTSLIFAFLLLAGCAAQRPPALSQSSLQQPDEEGPQASALVFSAPLTADQPPVFLARDRRQPSAFLSFEELSTTFYDIYTKDRQTNDGSDCYQRTAIMERVGMSYR